MTEAQQISDLVKKLEILQKKSDVRYIELSKALKKAESKIHFQGQEQKKATKMHKSLTQFCQIIQKQVEQIKTRITDNESNIRRFGSKR